MTALGLLSRRLRARAETAVRRLLGRTVSEEECRRDLQAMYAAPDPWKMAGDKEQFRFAETNRILVRELIAPAPRVGSILELGCGEGHQSVHLAKLCDRLTGLDVVPDAVARARTRLPHAELIAGDVRAQPWAGERGRFDIVTACEVLYFFEDVPRMLDLISRLGRACLVTCHHPSNYVGRPLRAMPVAGRETFRFGDTVWWAAWWRSG